jgi:prophage regulatory protein
VSSWIVHEIFEEIPECAEHIPLSVAFAQFVAVECDGDPFDREALRAELRSASCAQELMRWFVRLLQTGKIGSAGRPLGGGPVKQIKADHWHADDVAERFISSSYAREKPYDAQALHDTWLFIPEADFRVLWEEMKQKILGPAQTSNRTSKPTITTARHVDTEGQLLGLPAVELIVGMRRSTIYKLIGEDRFPSQVKVGGRSLWLRKDVEAWIEQLSGSTGS